mgnify:FL=1
MKVVKALPKIIIVVILSFVIVYVLNKGTLDKASRPIKEISSENYTEAIKNQIEIDDTVSIKGTPNLLAQVSQESLVTGSTSERKIDYYYVGLKEYGFDFVVRIIPGKLTAEEQTFTGRVTGLASTEFGTRIKNSLNKPINFDESVNEQASNELDTESKEQLSQKSEANFANSTLLILDEEVVEYSTAFGTVVFWTAILSVFLITLFRKKIL